MVLGGWETMEQVFIVDGARTAFTSFGGSFAQTKADELGAETAKEALKRSGISPEEVEHVLYGNVIHSSTNASFLARHIALKAGIPVTVPAMNLNRLCGSGCQSIISAAQLIKLGEAGIVLCGGAENMSMAPYANFDARFGAAKMGAMTFEDMVQRTLTDEYIGKGMGMTAEKLAQDYEITREMQDEFAILSQTRATNAQQEGKFEEEIVGVEVRSKKGPLLIDRDEYIKPQVTMDKLQKLSPAFLENGTVTPGNASGINDGAASLVVASEKKVKEMNLHPIARIVSWAVAGVDPNVMGIGPVPAMKMALEKAGLSIEEIDLIEINEAFAAQYLAVEKELGLNREKTNVNGGAIALGHPVGASGTRIVLSLAYELRRRNLTYGAASLCIGGGQGIAIIIERV